MKRLRVWWLASHLVGLGAPIPVPVAHHRAPVLGCVLRGPAIPQPARPGVPMPALPCEVASGTGELRLLKGLT